MWKKYALKSCQDHDVKNKAKSIDQRVTTNLQVDMRIVKKYATTNNNNYYYYYYYYYYIIIIIVYSHHIQTQTTYNPKPFFLICSTPPLE